MTGRGLIAGLPLALFAGPVAALVLDGGIERQSDDGSFVKLSPAPGMVVGHDTFNDANLYAFNEAQQITLPAPVTVEIGGDDGQIAAGTVVSSHYVFFDSLHSFQFGHVRFDAPILGIATTQATLGATDALAGTGVRYLNPGQRGLESADRAWIDPDDPKVLRVYWAGSSPGDHIRVFTEARPALGM